MDNARIEYKKASSAAKNNLASSLRNATNKLLVVTNIASNLLTANPQLAMPDAVNSNAQPVVIIAPANVPAKNDAKPVETATQPASVKTTPKVESTPAVAPVVAQPNPVVGKTDTTTTVPANTTLVAPTARAPPVVGLPETDQIRIERIKRLIAASREEGIYNDEQFRSALINELNLLQANQQKLKDSLANNVIDRKLYDIQKNLRVSYPKDPRLNDVLYLYDASLDVIEHVEKGELDQAAVIISIINKYYYGIVSKSDVEYVGVNWDDFVSKMIGNDWAEVKSPTEIRLKFNFDETKDSIAKVFGGNFSKLSPILQPGLPRAFNIRRGIVDERNQDAGPNAWFVMAVTRYLYNKDTYTTEDKANLDLVLKLADYLVSLRDPEAFNAIRTEQHSGYHSTEHNISTRAALRMLNELLNQRQAQLGIDAAKAQSYQNKFNAAIRDIDGYLKSALRQKLYNGNIFNLELGIPL